MADRLPELVMSAMRAAEPQPNPMQASDPSSVSTRSDQLMMMKKNASTLVLLLCAAVISMANADTAMDTDIDSVHLPQMEQAHDAIVPESTQEPSNNNMVPQLRQEETLTETKLGANVGVGGYTGAMITGNAYCSNRIGSRGGTPGPKPSLASCAAAVNAHSSCGNQFSYSTSTKACDCVRPGQTCSPKSYSGRGFSTYQIVSKITGNAYCSNRIGSRGGTPGPKPSLASCAAAVDAHSSCGNQFSYSISTKACDCVRPGQTCSPKGYSGFSTYKTGAQAPPPPPSPQYDDHDEDYNDDSGDFGMHSW